MLPSAKKTRKLTFLLTVKFSSGERSLEPKMFIEKVTEHRQRDLRADYLISVGLHSPEDVDRSIILVTDV